MNLLLNGKELSLSDGDRATIIDLLASQQIKAMGIAVAVNNRIVGRDEWGQRTLQEGDRVTVIQATYGG